MFFFFFAKPAGKNHHVFFCGGGGGGGGGGGWGGRDPLKTGHTRPDMLKRLLQVNKVAMSTKAP